MSYSVLVTSRFEREAKRLVRRYRSLRTELIELVRQLETDPLRGTAIGHGCYKIRLSIKSKGKGKSTGARVITYVRVEAGRVYLLSIFDKSEQSSATDAEIKALLSNLP